jgi:hypothetical protein
MLIENNITGEKNVVGVEIIKDVAFSAIFVAYENTLSSSRVKFGTMCLDSSGI